MNRQLYRSARYLLRIDDLCPTMDRVRWRAVRNMIEVAGIHPILAIVPMNRDPELIRDASDPSFWEQMRDMERNGASIALHGLDHVCSSRGRSLIPLHRQSEFAGRSIDDQQARIASGLHILHERGLLPQLFVAPRHGFDRNTLLALRNCRLTSLCDGFHSAPGVHGGVTWIPQQLWAPVSRKAGLWTFCLHPNTVEDLEPWRSFVYTHKEQFTCFDEVIEDRQQPLNFIERVMARIRLNRCRIRNRLRS